MSTPPAFVCPFTLNDVRIAARKLVGAEVLSPAIEMELRSAVLGYQHRLRVLAHTNTAGAARQQRALRRVETSPAARLVSFILGNGSGKGKDKVNGKPPKSMTWGQIKSASLGVNIRKPSGEWVRATERRKRSGGTRWTCSFGPRARGAQRMVEHVILVVAGPSRYEHARKGRGRETAIRETLDSIEKKGVRWFGLLDVKDFFPSVTREMVKEALGFLPTSIIETTIFIHDDTDMKLNGLYGDKDKDSSASAIRKGIPQGSLASVLVAGKVLEQHLDKLAARHVVSHVDNVLIGGRTEEEVQSKVIALATSLEGHPGGLLRLTGDVLKLGDHMMDYLGYRFRRMWKNTDKQIGRVQFSERSRQGLHTRLASKLLFAPWKTWGQIIDTECARWVRSFPCWTTRLRNEDMAVIEAQENLLPLVDAARRIIDAMKLKWGSFHDFASFAAFADDLAARIGRSVPRLRTTGGAANFETVSKNATPEEWFEALLRQNAKNIVLSVG